MLAFTSRVASASMAAVWRLQASPPEEILPAGCESPWVALRPTNGLGILNPGVSRSWAVRLLMYRRCDSRERVESTAAFHLNGGRRRRVPRKSVTRL
jgi:hypothetical protein